MANQAGIDISPDGRNCVALLESHCLAGGDIRKVVVAIIASNRAGLDMSFDRATAIDLSGRDLSAAVQGSIFPRVIDCPPRSSIPTSLSAVAKDGVELKIRARVTVRTNLEQLIGGATEETIIAGVGESIISSIGSSDKHQDVLENPDRISKAVLDRGLER